MCLNVFCILDISRKNDFVLLSASYLYIVLLINTGLLIKMNENKQK